MENLVLTFAGGKRLQNTIAPTAGNVATNLSPATGKRWLLQRGYIVLDTDGNAADRYIKLSTTDGTDITELFPVASNATVLNKVESLSFGELTYSLGIGVVLSDRAGHIGIRPILLEEADQFRIEIHNGLAGDSYSGRVVVLEI